MKKNLFCLTLTLILMIITSNCFAMSFSQPVKIDEIIYRWTGHHGATNIKDYSTVDIFGNTISRQKKS